MWRRRRSHKYWRWWKKIKNLIYNKFVLVYNDNKIKLKYDIDNDNFKFDENIIKYEIGNLEKGKAVSWDYTPVETLRKIIDNKNIENNERIIKSLKELFDKLLTPEIPIPREIATSRLIVLNKNMNECGDINRIRPICIQSTILKLLERSLYFHFHKEIIKKLNKAQIGFIGVVGTEINLLLLREKCMDLKLQNNDNIFVLFIDISGAYDNVNKEILFRKMVKMKVEKQFINSIKKIYSYTQICIDPLYKILMLIRSITGIELAPLLFNIFIDDLIDELQLKTNTVLAYADDIAVICNGQIGLDYAIETIEKWCDENIMKLNYCKSGILILKGRLRNIRELKKKIILLIKVNVGCLINNNSNDNCSNYDAEGFDKSDGNDTNTTNSNISLLYKNIPIFEEYKYLCIELNNKLNPVNHLKNVNIKLLKKNEQINNFK